jgi:hypothetical protein
VTNEGENKEKGQVYCTVQYTIQREVASGKVGGKGIKTTGAGSSWQFQRSGHM